MAMQPATPKPRKALTAPRKAGARNRAPNTPVWRRVALVAAIIFVLDQALKYLVVHLLQLDRVREIDVLPPWLNLRMAWNQGMNFGLFSSDVDVMRWVLIAIAVAVCVWVGAWVLRANPSRLAQISAGFLIGGALGNVIDRLMYGAVADFLNMSLPGWQNPYSFNVADIAIFIGALGLVLQPPEAKSSPAKRREPARSGAAKPPAAAKPVTRATTKPPSRAAQGELSLDDPAGGDKPRDEGGNSR
ncbi:signal peptidase II [Paracoccus sp. PAR01]|uniref:signal peptidase II n=1 Tax=Paracoccus sp. PAR01 TaxID=2769282 RepID=UPI001CE053BC|nr:signal peptidase II [Paracoccus sp. PAR01]